MKCFRAGILAVAVLSFAMAADSDSAFVGTWKLDAAKSKFTPGPGPKAETVTISPDGKVTIDETMPDGSALNWSYTYAEDQTVPITGMDNSSVKEKRLDSRHVEHDWKLGESTLHGKGVIMKNGKTMRYTMTGTGPGGKPESDVMIFEKQ